MKLIITLLVALTLVGTTSAAIKKPGADPAMAAATLLDTTVPGGGAVLGAGCVGVGYSYGTTFANSSHRYRVWHQLRCNVYTKNIPGGAPGTGFKRYWLTIVVTAPAATPQSHPTLKITGVDYVGCFLDHASKEPCP